MTQIGPLNDLPIACTLTPDAGKVQVEKWQTFNADYGLTTERTDGRITIHYAKVDDSIRRLRELIETESACCAFVTWDIDDTHHDLRLIVTGSPDQLAALTSARQQPVY